MASFDISSVKDKVEKFVESYPAIDGPLSQVSEKVKLDKGYIALLICALPIVVAFIFGGANILVDMAAYIYPTYASIKVSLKLNSCLNGVKINSKKSLNIN